MSRDRLAAKMTPAQIEQAKALVAAWTLASRDIAARLALACVRERLVDGSFSAGAVTLRPALSLVAEFVPKNHDLPSSMKADFGWALGLKRAIGGHYFEILLTNNNATHADQYVTSTYQGTPLDRPESPAGLTAVPGESLITLSWKASAGASSYTVKRSSSPGAPFTTLASPEGTTHGDRDVNYRSTYSYTISAANAAGRSAPSGPVTATPRPPAE